MDKVAGHLYRQEGKRVRPALATLFRSTQHAMEPFTFGFLHIISDDLKGLYPVFAGHNTRRRFLRDFHQDTAIQRPSQGVSCTRCVS